jgi:hypothetical protein
MAYNSITDQEEGMENCQIISTLCDEPFCLKSNLNA